MESRRFEEMGRRWADTAHTTELQRAGLTRFPSSVASSVSDDATEAGQHIEGKRSANKKAELGCFLFWRMSPHPSGAVFFASHETPLPIQAFAKDPHLTHFELHPGGSASASGSLGSSFLSNSSTLR